MKNLLVEDILQVGWEDAQELSHSAWLLTLDLVSDWEKVAKLYAEAALLFKAVAWFKAYAAIDTDEALEWYKAFGSDLAKAYALHKEEAFV